MYMGRFTGTQVFARDYTGHLYADFKTRAAQQVVAQVTV